MNRLPNDNSNADRFDDLFDQVSRFDIDADRLARMEGYWQGVNTKRRRRRNLVGGIATGLVIVLACGLWQLRDDNGPSLAKPAEKRKQQSTDPLEAPSKKPPETMLADEMRIMGGPNWKPHAIENSGTPSQLVNNDEASDPTSYSRVFETAVLVAARRQMGVPQPRRSGLDQFDRDNIRQALLAQVEHGETKIIIPRGKETLYELEVQDLVRQHQGAERVAAAHLLCEIATHRSQGLLYELHSQELTHVPATKALARMATPNELYRLTRVEESPALRGILAASLLNQERPEAVSLFLRLASDEKTSTDALASVGMVSAGTLELLLAQLESSRVAERTAAARVLSRVANCHVAETLADMVVENKSRREALIALAASRCPEAGQFIDFAKSNMQLAGSVLAAERFVQNFPN